jgi:D-alanine-D-alanine ligase
MKRGKALILYGTVESEASVDEKDTLIQAETVRSALLGLGWDAADLRVSLDLSAAADALARARPAFVFNLVETLAGKGRLIAVLPSLLGSMRIPFTGATTEAIFLTSNKLLAKKLLSRAGIATPPWLEASRLRSGDVPPFGPPYIIKDVWEHASIGLDDEAVASSSGALQAQIERRAANGGIGDVYVESYVDGREFNLALLGGTGDPANPESLPPAEIEFHGYPEGKPRVVGFKAKWDEASYEFNNTPRRFDFAEEDRPLLSKLVGISRACWDLFALRGYARVDFRVDAHGNPWVLEINTNPCIAPDSGFAAAAARAGLDIGRIVERIVSDAIGKDAQ